MNGNDQLVEQLTGLDESDFASVVERARRQRIEQQQRLPDRPEKLDRDSLAAWYARKHLWIEPTLREVIYLPEGAPKSEIRFLEVSTLSTIPDDAPIEAIDFGVDLDLPVEHRLLVADLSPGQWERILDSTLALPVGWNLQNSHTYARRRPG